MANCYWPGGGKEGQFPPAAHVPDTLGQSGVLISSLTNFPTMALISKGFQNFGKEIPTFMDSEASNTMFVSREMFTKYTPTASQVGDSAKVVNGGFEIVGEGNVVQQYRADGKECTVTHTHALHTPVLNANLISISAFDRAGLTTTFHNGQGIVQRADGTVVLAGKNVNGMYILDTYL